MSPSVLVVEDYADLRSAIVATLSRREYDCESVNTAEAAIDKLRKHQYETILLAPRLPITSDPVMHFLHEYQPEQLARVILMTSPEVDEGLCDDPDDCRVLAKPFNNEQLFATLKP
jgi:DNA-binding response OmpR family regulator